MFNNYIRVNDEALFYDDFCISCPKAFKESDIGVQSCPVCGDFSDKNCYRYDIYQEILKIIEEANKEIVRLIK